MVFFSSITYLNPQQFTNLEASSAAGRYRDCDPEADINMCPEEPECPQGLNGEDQGRLGGICRPVTCNYNGTPGSGLVFYGHCSSRGPCAPGPNGEVLSRIGSACVGECDNPYSTNPEDTGLIIRDLVDGNDECRLPETRSDVRLPNYDRTHPDYCTGRSDAIWYPHDFDKRCFIEDMKDLVNKYIPHLVCEAFVHSPLACLELAHVEIRQDDALLVY